MEKAKKESDRNYSGRNRQSVMLTIYIILQTWFMLTLCTCTMGKLVIEELSISIQLLRAGINGGLFKSSGVSLKSIHTTFNILTHFDIYQWSNSSTLTSFTSSSSTQVNLHTKAITPNNNHCSWSQS